jgi:hypothetical protein
MPITPARLRFSPQNTDTGVDLSIELVPRHVGFVPSVVRDHTTSARLDLIIPERLRIRHWEGYDKVMSGARQGRHRRANSLGPVI